MTHDPSASVDVEKKEDNIAEGSPAENEVSAVLAEPSPPTGEENAELQSDPKPSGDESPQPGDSDSSDATPPITQGQEVPAEAVPVPVEETKTEAATTGNESKK